MSVSSPLRLLLLAPPDAPGARALLDRAQAEHARGRRLDVLLTGAGLAWADDGALGRLARREGAAVGICSRSARDRGVTPDSLPGHLRWTSLVAFCTALEPGAELWGALP